MVHPAEESPPASFDSARSFGDSPPTALVTSAGPFTVGKGQLQPPHNIPFPDVHNCDGDQGVDVESRDQESRVSELLEGEGM